jgi:murein DD-endopeptidase MepM/ murein hydrolase activator NlpD
MRLRKYFYIILLVALGVGVSMLIPELEWKAPEVRVNLPSKYVGTKPFEIEVNDDGKGVRRIEVVLKDRFGETPVVQKTFDPPSRSERVKVSIDPKSIGMQEGEATLIVTAVDASKLRFLDGNKTVVTRDIVIDLVPPRVSPVSSQHYVNFGGAGIAIYTVSEDAARSGIRIGDHTFEGSFGYFGNERVGLVLFAHPYDTPDGARAQLFAEDEAGNVGVADFPYILRKRTYRDSTMSVTDEFISRKVIPLLPQGVKKESLLDAFIYVNRDLRKENNERIRKITSSITPSLMWDGPFHQLTNSKVEANFADYRTYLYGGEKVDQEYHLGYDLAVVKRYVVEAAANGVVAFAGDLGIYGQSVIIDHGYGLFTLYSHMSSINVKEGDRVEKKAVIGRTGETGLAGGDHLHYGVYIQGVAVDPVEWWDKGWITDNILLHLEKAEAEFGVAKPRTGMLYEGEAKQSQANSHQERN